MTLELHPKLPRPMMILAIVVCVWSFRVLATQVVTNQDSDIILLKDLTKNRDQKHRSICYYDAENVTLIMSNTKNRIPGLAQCYFSKIVSTESATLIPTSKSMSSSEVTEMSSGTSESPTGGRSSLESRTTFSATSTPQTSTSRLQETSAIAFSSSESTPSTVVTTTSARLVKTTEDHPQTTTMADAPPSSTTTNDTTSTVNAPTTTSIETSTTTPETSTVLTTTEPARRTVTSTAVPEPATSGVTISESKKSTLSTTVLSPDTSTTMDTSKSTSIKTASRTTSQSTITSSGTVTTKPQTFSTLPPSTTESTFEATKEPSTSDRPSSSTKTSGKPTTKSTLVGSTTMKTTPGATTSTTSSSTRASTVTSTTTSSSTTSLDAPTTTRISDAQATSTTLTPASTSFEDLTTSAKETEETTTPSTTSARNTEKQITTTTTESKGTQKSEKSTADMDVTTRTTAETTRATSSTQTTTGEPSTSKISTGKPQTTTEFVTTSKTTEASTTSSTKIPTTEKQENTTGEEIGTTDTPTTSAPVTTATPSTTTSTTEMLKMTTGQETETTGNMESTKASSTIATSEKPTASDTKKATTSKPKTSTAAATSSEKLATSETKETTTSKTSTATTTTSEMPTASESKTTTPKPKTSTAATSTTEGQAVTDDRTTTFTMESKTNTQSTTSPTSKSTLTATAPSTTSKKPTTTGKPTSATTQQTTTATSASNMAKTSATTAKPSQTTPAKTDSTTAEKTDSTTSKKTPTVPTTAVTKDSSTATKISSAASMKTSQTSSAPSNKTSPTVPTKAPSSSTKNASATSDSTSTAKSTEAASTTQSTKSEKTTTTATTTAAPITTSSYEHLLRTTHPVADTKAHPTITSQPPSERCDEECPEGYIVGATACLFPVPFYYANSYQRAFGFCASFPHSVLLTEHDLVFNRPAILQWAKTTNITLLERDIYLFAKPVPYIENGEAFVELVTLGNLTLERINRTRVGFYEKKEGRTALCMVPKYCQSLNCPMEEVYERLPAELPFPRIDEINYGETLKVACVPPSSTVLSLTCHPFAVIRPYVFKLQCDFPPGFEPELDTPSNPRIRSTCDDCYQWGTEACEPVEGGFICRCKPRWHRHTCYKVEEVCKDRNDNGLCSGRGSCTSLLGEFSCSCDQFYHGRSCQLDSRKATLLGGDEHIPILSAPTISFGMMFAGSVVIWLSINLTNVILFQSFSEDPQTVFVLLRNVNIFFASFTATFFGRPVFISYYVHTYRVVCRMAYNLHFGCVYYALVLLVSEAWTLYYVYAAKGSNFWDFDPYGKKNWKLSIDYGLLWGIPILLLAIGFGNWDLWDRIYMSSTCIGPVNIRDPAYLAPIALLGFLTSAVIYYNIRAYRERVNNEENFTFMLHYMEVKLPLKISRLERVSRNRWFSLVLAPTLFLHYVLSQAAMDWVGESPIWLNLAVVFLTVLWVVVALLQFATVHDQILEFFMVRLQPVMPQLPWPLLSPVTLMNHDEIKAYKTGEKVENPGCWKTWKFHPRYPEFLSEENRIHYLRKFSSRYLLLRTEGDMKKIEAMQAIFEEHEELLNKTSYMAEQVRELSTWWMLELNNWDVHNLRLWHCKCDTEAEEARQFIDHPFMSRSGIDEELKIATGMKRLRAAMHFRRVRIHQTAPVLRKGKSSMLDVFYGLFLEWKEEKPKFKPGRQRRHLPRVEQMYKEHLEDQHIQRCLDDPESDFAIDYLFNEERPTFIGPRQQGSMFSFPFMEDFMKLKWFDERLNGQEWLEIFFDHWASVRLITVDGIPNRMDAFEQQTRWVREYESKRRKYDRGELIWRLYGRREDYEQNKTYAQLKKERPPFEDVYTEYKEDKFATLPHELALMQRDERLPMPPNRPRNVYLEELPPRFERVRDPGFVDAPEQEF